jgi:hypothetical protein
MISEMNLWNCRGPFQGGDRSTHVSILQELKIGDWDLWPVRWMKQLADYVVSQSVSTCTNSRQNWSKFHFVWMFHTLEWALNIFHHCDGGLWEFITIHWLTNWSKQWSGKRWLSNWVISSHCIQFHEKSDSLSQTWVVFSNLYQILALSVRSHGPNESWNPRHFLFRIIILELFGHLFKSRDCDFDNIL